MNKIAAFLRESAVARFLIPAGIMIIAFGIVVFVINRQNSAYIKTEATVSGTELEQEAYRDSDGTLHDATYVVRLKYTVGGREYEAELGGLPDYEEGKTMTIYYDPDDPGQITQTKSLILPLVMIAAGAAALAGGIVSGVHAVKRYSRMKKQEKEWANGR